MILVGWLVYGMLTLDELFNAEVSLIIIVFVVQKYIFIIIFYREKLFKKSQTDLFDS